MRLAELVDLPAILSASGNGRYWKEAGFRSVPSYKKLVTLAIRAQTRVAHYQKSWLWALDLGGARNAGMAYFVETYPNVGEGLAGIFSAGQRRRMAAVEAICICIHIIFSYLNYKKIFISVRPNNIDSFRISTGLGFVVNGTRDADDPPSEAPPMELLLELSVDAYYRNSLVNRLLRATSIDESS